MEFHHLQLHGFTGTMHIGRYRKCLRGHFFIAPEPHAWIGAPGARSEGAALASTCSRLWRGLIFARCGRSNWCCMILVSYSTLPSSSWSATLAQHTSSALSCCVHHTWDTQAHDAGDLQLPFTVPPRDHPCLTAQGQRSSNSVPSLQAARQSLFKAACQVGLRRCVLNSSAAVCALV